MSDPVMCGRVLDEAMLHQVMNERVLDGSRWRCARMGWLQRVVKPDAHVLLAYVVSS